MLKLSSQNRMMPVFISALLLCSGSLVHAGFTSSASGKVVITPTGVDTDGDGIDDALDPDLDNDGLSNSLPVPLNGDADSCPYLPDCDFDGLTDGDEVSRGSDPEVADSDGDGVNDGDEVAAGTDPTVNPATVDTDGDGLRDVAERDVHGTDPAVADSDSDGLNDGDEIARGTDPNLGDTDGDGVSDGDEVADGTDPAAADTAVASFAATPFVVDCSTTPGSCSVSGTVPPRATSVTVQGLISDVTLTPVTAVISGSSFTATIPNIDRNGAWSFVATASATGEASVQSSAVAHTVSNAFVFSDTTNDNIAIDCASGVGRCRITGTAPVGTAQLTFAGTGPGGATASETIAVSGDGTFDATIGGLTPGSWSYVITANTASDGTGLAATSSSFSDTVGAYPALADSDFSLAPNDDGVYTALTGWPSTVGSSDYDVVSRSPVSSTMTFVANDGSTIELEKVSGRGSVSGATWTGTEYGWDSPYATLRARKVDSSGYPTTDWSSNFTLRRAVAATENVTIPTGRLLDAANYNSAVVTLPGVDFSRRDNNGNTTNATNVSNGNVTYFSDTPSVCTVDGNRLTAVGSGDCTLRATYAAVGDNSPGDGDPVTFTMPAVQVQAALVLDTSGITFVNNRATLAASGGTGSGTISYEITPSQEHRDVPNQNDANSICRVDDGNTLVGLGIGPCKIKVTRNGEGPYADRSDTFTLNINTSMIARDCVADMTRNDGICPTGYELAYVNELRACSGETNFSSADFFEWTGNRDSSGNYDLRTTDRLHVLYVKYNGRSGPNSPWEVRTHSRNLGGGHRTLKSAADAHRSSMTAAVCRGGTLQANCAYQLWARPGQSEVWPLSNANRNAWMGDGWKDVVQSSASSASAATRSLATGRAARKAVGCVRPIP